MYDALGANGARAEGMEANLFFTFFGLDAIHKTRIDHIKVASFEMPSRAYLGSDSHAMGLLVGVALGILAGARTPWEAASSRYS